MESNSPLGLISPKQYQQERSSVFGSTESLRWFTRHHRLELADRGALVAPAGRMLINPEAFDQAVLAIGAKKAAGR